MDRPAHVSTAFFLALVLLHPSAAEAQSDPEGAAVSPDSADVLREGMRRPPSQHPLTLGDVVEFPLRVATFPVRFVLGGLVMLTEMKADPEFLGTLVRVHRAVGEAGFRPGLTTDLGPRSGLATTLAWVGLRPVVLETGISVRGYQRHRIGVEGEAGRWSFGGAAGFRRWTSEHFWGIGIDSSEGLRSDFRWDRVDAEAHVALEARPDLTVSLETGVEENQVAPGTDDALPGLHDTFESQLPFGADEITRFWRVGASATLERIRRDTLHLSGLRGRVAASRYEGIDHTPASFTRVLAWLHGYVPTGSRSLVALRVRAEMSRGEGRGVPFTHQSVLGGGMGLRGYSWDRFRDRDLLLGTVEWRYEVWRDLRERGRAEGFVFWDEGAVARSLDDLPRSRSSWGFGLGLSWGGEAMGRAYLAFSDEGARLSADVSSWAF